MPTKFKPGGGAPKKGRARFRDRRAGRPPRAFPDRIEEIDSLVSKLRAEVLEAYDCEPDLATGTEIINSCLDAIVALSAERVSLAGMPRPFRGGVTRKENA